MTRIALKMKVCWQLLETLRERGRQGGVTPWKGQRLGDNAISYLRKVKRDNIVISRPLSAKNTAAILHL